MNPVLLRWASSLDIRSKLKGQCKTIIYKRGVEFLFKFTVYLRIKLHRLFLFVHIYNRQMILMWWRKTDEHIILSTSYYHFHSISFY